MKLRETCVDGSREHDSSGSEMTVRGTAEAASLKKRGGDKRRWQRDSASDSRVQALGHREDVRQGEALRKIAGVLLRGPRGEWDYETAVRRGVMLVRRRVRSSGPIPGARALVGVESEFTSIPFTPLRRHRATIPPRAAWSAQSRRC